jgi:hypothetical protein
MKVICAAIIIALAAGPALAEQKSPPRPEPGVPPKSQQEIEADKAAEQAYQKSLGNIPDKGPVDPWGSVRSDNAPKPVAKSTRPKPKNADYRNSDNKAAAKVQEPEH